MPRSTGNPVRPSSRSAMSRTQQSAPACFSPQRSLPTGDIFTAGRSEAGALAKIDIVACCMAMACQRGRHAVA
jgi:hypothetical protein